MFDGVLKAEGLVLDERNMPGKTLGLRRLQCGRSDLYPLKKAVLNRVNLIKSRKSLFIDNYGTIVRYEKTKYLPLKHFHIERIEGKGGSFSLVWCYNCNCPFKIPRPPIDDYEWCRILTFNGFPWILYDFVSNKGSDTRRKV